MQHRIKRQVWHWAWNSVAAIGWRKGAGEKDTPCSYATRLKGLKCFTDIPDGSLARYRNRCIARYSSPSNFWTSVAAQIESCNAIQRGHFIFEDLAFESFNTSDFLGIFLILESGLTTGTSSYVMCLVFCFFYRLRVLDDRIVCLSVRIFDHSSFLEAVPLLDLLFLHTDAGSQVATYIICAQLYEHQYTME